MSLPAMNQVYFTFLAVLDRMRTPKASPPEALDARWFALDDYPNTAMWVTAVGFDIAEIFEQVRTGRFYFHQWTSEWVRSFGPLSPAKLCVM